MKTPYMVGAVGLWIAGLLGIVVAGWGHHIATWRFVGAFLLLLAALTGLMMAMRQGRGDAAVAALAASLAVTIVLPNPVSSFSATLGLLLAFGAVFAAYYVISLSIRSHTVHGPVLQHGASRIAGTTATAAGIVLLTITSVRAGTAATSARWAASLDIGSVQLFVATACILFAMLTGISLLALSRGYNVDQDATGKADPEDVSSEWEVSPQMAPVRDERAT